MYTVRAPVALCARLLEPLLLQRLQLVQAQVDMLCVARDWCCAIELAARVLQLKRFEQVTALVALVTSRILVIAKRTGALNEAVRKKTLMCLAVRLSCGLLLKVAVLV